MMAELRMVPNGDPSWVAFKTDDAAGKAVGRFDGVRYDTHDRVFRVAVALWPDLLSWAMHSGITVVDLAPPPTTGRNQPPRFVREPRHPDQDAINARGIVKVRAAKAKREGALPAEPPDDDPWSWNP
jgi:hypothetical protein